MIKVKHVPSCLPDKWDLFRVAFGFVKSSKLIIGGNLKVLIGVTTTLFRPRLESPIVDIMIFSLFWVAKI